MNNCQTVDTVSIMFRKIKVRTMNRFFMVMAGIGLMISNVNARIPADATAKTCAFHGVEYIQHNIQLGQSEAELLCPVAPQSLIDQFSDADSDDGAPPKDDRPHDDECYSWWYH